MAARVSAPVFRHALTPPSFFAGGKVSLPEFRFALSLIQIYTIGLIALTLSTPGAVLRLHLLGLTGVGDGVNTEEPADTGRNTIGAG